MLPRNLFPRSSQGEFYFNVRLPEGTALARHRRARSTASRAPVAERPARASSSTPAPARPTSRRSRARRARRTAARSRWCMKKRHRRTGEADVAGTTARGAWTRRPGSAYEFERPALLTFKNPVEVEVYAYDLDTLRTLSAAVAQRSSRGVPGVEDVETSMRLGDPEVQIAFDRDRLAALNLDPAAASRLVRNAVQGEAATQFSDLDRKLDVRVRATEDRALRGRAAGEPRGGPQRGPARAAGRGRATCTVERGPSEIRRIAPAARGGRVRRTSRAATSARPRRRSSARSPGCTCRRARKVVARRPEPRAGRVVRLAALRAPARGVPGLPGDGEPVRVAAPPVRASCSRCRWRWSAWSLTLVLTGTSISVMVLIGLVVLAGIVVNNAIVLVDYANQLRARGVPQGRRAGRGRAGAHAADPDDHAHHGARPAADGARASARAPRCAPRSRSP